MYGTVKIYANAYISNIYISYVNYIHSTSLYMYKCDILESICAKDTNIEHEIKYDMKKIYSMRLIYVKNHKNIKGKIENTYIS